MKIMINLFYLILIPSLSFAQEAEKEPCPCCTPAHQQFDFWIGDWTVYNGEGKELGKNKIVALQDHCIIQENWTAKKYSGSSYNYYNRKDKSWNQVWVDNVGSSLALKGGMENGKMILYGASNEKNERNKISWTPMDDGSVVQIWETVDAEGKVLSEVFKGIYKKEK